MFTILIILFEMVLKCYIPECSAACFYYPFRLHQRNEGYECLRKACKKRGLIITAPNISMGALFHGHSFAFYCPKTKGVLQLC
jgi:hypothetical protein